jgi:tape measure domain-containing protein
MEEGERMSTVDNRIVSMQFDNGAFESKLGETMKSLDSLKKSLDFSNSQKNLGDLENAGKNFNMGNMGGVVEGISGKFLALATVGVTALATITAKAVSSGAAFVNSFSFQPIMDGFHEFETNMNSIQTILANTSSKGSTLADVNKALQELNTYSDKTIYNFSEMARNIGTFTAAGVDLKTSVSSIKGIANLAAISGSSSEQASTAMYQLSQAIASGSVKLMDWNSVVNAGMGGESFQKALFESGKAMKTLTNVPAGQTFEEWKKAGNSFRDSLQSGWVNTKVLTSTLQAFTGDLTEAQIMAMGYTKAQAAELLKLGQTGLQAATQVKTFTQLIGTVKEAVGSGWTQTFQTIFGDFNESVALFTSMNNVIGKFVGASADARNELLKGWKDLGGRTMLIDAFKNAFTALGKVFGTIKDAFREIFPPTTSKDLIDMTQAFLDFTKALIPAPQTLNEIKRIFAGLFSVFSIFKEVVKGVFSVFASLIGNLSGAGDGALAAGASFGDLLTHLNDVLVKGGAIREFFAKVSAAVADLGGFFSNIIESVVGFFKAFSGSREMTTAVEGVSAGFDRLSEAGGRFVSLGDKIMKVLDAIKGVFSAIWQYIGTWLGELGHKMAAALGPADFNGVVDIVNVGLLGGLVVLFKKFLSGGLKFDLGGGMFEKIKESLDGVTGTLKSMQTELKAKALMEIAIALGVLTASIVVLSLIDSAALSKALVAITIGFGQLIGAMTALDKIIGGAGSAAKLGIVAAGMTVMAGAVLVLSGAIRVLSSLSPAELATGLAGIAGALAIMIGATQFMSTNAKGLIAGGIAMAAMATSLNILALAVKSFAEMSWGDMAKGLVGIGVALGLITTAMNFMPGPTILAAGIGMIGVATGLRILANAIAAFGEISWPDMAKGFVGIGVGLGIIVVAMNAMPLTLPIIAAGLILVSIALMGMAEAVKMMGENDLGELTKGLGAFAIMLGVLVVAVNAMTMGLAGAAALLVVSGALLVLSHVLTTLGQLSLAELAIGLGAIAGVLVVLGLAALVMQPIVPTLYALGVAMAILGGSFALFGIGAFLAAKAFEAVANAGKAGIAILIDSIVLLIKALPKFVMALVHSLVESAEDFLQAGATLLKIATVFLGQLLDTVIELAPKIAAAIVAIVTGALKIIREKFPDIFATGIEILWTLLQGIKNNIGWITEAGVDIVVRFAKALSDNADKLVNSAVDLLLAFTEAIAARAGDIAGAGLNLLLAFIKGISDNVNKIVETVGTLIASFITALSNNYQKIIDAGANAIIKFVEGIGRDITKVVTKGTDVAIAFINAIGDNAVKFANAAGDALVDFLNGMADAIRTHSKELRDAGINIAEAIADGMTFGLAGKAKDVADGALGLAGKAVSGVGHFLGIGSPSRVFREIGGFMAAGMAMGLDKDQTAENSAVAQAERIVAAFSKTLGDNPDMLIGLDASPVITPVLDLTKVKAGATGLSNLLTTPTITPDVSIAQARTIATTAELTSGGDTTPAYTGPSEVKFEQNIFSPEALSTNDIYRNTKSQIALAKEELKI